MKIMIDYDDTYTADIEMWRRIIPVFLEQHQVYLVTSRGDDTPIDLDHHFVEWGIPVIYCDYRAKKTVCDELGIKIDIWIDDNPHYITTGFVVNA